MRSVLDVRQRDLKGFLDVTNRKIRSKNIERNNVLCLKEWIKGKIRGNVFLVGFEFL